MDTPAFKDALAKAMRAYHGLFGVPIKEATWELILAEAAAASGVSCDWSPGSHVSGVDVVVGGVAYSCKSTRRRLGRGAPPKAIDISSFRLTKRSGSSADLIDEIDVVRNNYDAYALLLRESRSTENGEDIVAYRVYSIPSSYLKAGALAWSQAANGDWCGVAPAALAAPDPEVEEGEIVAPLAALPALPPPPPVPYTMKVVRTMSCQLWMNVPLSYIEDCLVCEVPMVATKKTSLIEVYASMYSAPIVRVGVSVGTQTAEPEPDAPEAPDVDALVDALTELLVAEAASSSAAPPKVTPASASASASAAGAGAAPTASIRD